MKRLKAFQTSFKDMFYLLSFFWRFGKGYFIITLLVELTVVPLTTFFNFHLLRAAVDAIARGETFISIVSLIGVYLCLLTAVKLIRDLHNFYGSSIESKIMDKIRRLVYKKALETDYNFINNPEYLDNYTWTINDFTDYVYTAKSSVISFLTSCSTVFVIISMMSSVSIVLTAFIIINIIVSTLISFPKNKLSHDFDEKLVLPIRKTGYVNRIFYLREHAADLKCSRAAEFMFAGYDKVSDEKASIIKRFAAKRLLFATFDNFNYSITSFLIMAYLTHQITQKDLGIGSFSALFGASWSLRENISGIVDIIISAQSISFYVQKMRVFMDAKSKIESPDNAAELTAPQTYSPFKIDLSGASFRYEHSNFELKDIDMHIPAGAKIAIVGENGSGKSTLVKLLLRLYDFDSGSYEIDGTDIKKYDIHKIRSEIGAAFQQPIVYSFSLKDNVKLYREVPDKKVREVLRMLDLTKVLEKSGADIDSYITKEFSEDGIELSGGEEQKLALSRIYTGDFGLLLLDEPSSALDPFAEAKLNKVIWDKNIKATTVVISHRLSNVVDADMIYLMKDGEIAEKGTHSELIRKKGIYYEMFEAQAEKYRNE